MSEKKFYYNNEVGCYTGDRINPDDVECPQRPSLAHVWTKQGWELDEDLDAKEKITTLEASVTPRMLREAALGITDSRAMLQSIQDQIVTERSKLKPR